MKEKILKKLLGLVFGKLKIFVVVEHRTDQECLTQHLLAYSPVDKRLKLIKLRQIVCALGC